MKKNYSTRFLELANYSYGNVNEGKELINEFTLNRLLSKHYKDGFILISTCRNELSGQENILGYEWLKERMNGCSFPYKNVFGGFIENKGKPNETQVLESAMLIMNSRAGTGEPIEGSEEIKEFGFELMREIDILGAELFGAERVSAFAQDCFLYKPQGDTKDAFFIKTDGKIVDTFNNVIVNDITQEYFTAINKSRNPDKADRRITFDFKKDDTQS